MENQLVGRLQSCPDQHGHFHISREHWESCRDLARRSECRLGADRGSALKESINES